MSSPPLPTPHHQHLNSLPRTVEFTPKTQQQTQTIRFFNDPHFQSITFFDCTFSKIKKIESLSAQMNSPETSSGGGSTPPGRRGVQLQGPRPSPLSISKESRKIGKTATASKPPLPVPPGRPPRVPETDNREPVVIYAVSPKPIHIDASDFKSLVQRLTGRSSSTPASSSTADEFAAGGPISPAARLATMERFSPTGRESERERERSAVKNELELMNMVDWEAGMLDLGQIPGILSPAPANLPALPAAIFSPVVESQALFGFQDNLMSPFLPGNCFLPSPSSASSSVFPGAINFSPTPSPVFDFSTIFDSF